MDENFKGATGTAPQDILKYPTYILRGATSNTRWWESGTPTYWNNTKTLYDPCPIGYQLPAGEIFKVMSLTGENITAAGEGRNINIWDDNSGDEKKGAWVYAKAHSSTIPNSDRYTPIVYFPATGEYSGTDASKTMREKYGDKTLSYLWTYLLDTEQYAQRVIFVPAKQTSTSNPFVYNGQFNPCSALPIRPVQITVP